ncbi:MAG: Fic family protein [Nocardioidaceae bacterium]|nr:Fic family protein [Nocardioidaceae bacterium]
MSAVAVPPHERHEVPWRQSVRGGTAEDRKLRSVVTSIPPDLAAVRVDVPAPVVARAEDAVRAIVAVDTDHGDHLRPLASLLLRAESVASSKIEHEEASTDDYARALHGSRANASATSMVANTEALARMLDQPVDASSIRTAHRLLMADDRRESADAGRWRRVQNWIGGSDHSPRGALYVPPPARFVAPKMADLVAFAHRSDLPVLPQAALAHAQFESIHPFPDGNGRIGRALAASVLRHRGTARQVVVPIASALVADRDGYFGALEAYRAGDGQPIVAAFSEAALVAAEEARTTGARLAAFPGHWHDLAGGPRRDSATAAVLAILAAEPVFAADDLQQRLGLPLASVYRAIERLAGAEVIRPLTDRKRNQVWGAVDLLDELDDIGVRIAARVRSR